MSFPGTGITDKDDISSCADKLTGTTVINDAFINRGLEGKIKILNPLLGGKFCLSITLTVAVLLPVILLIF